MKKSLIIVSLLAAFVILQSCEKDTPLLPPSIEGHWIGTYNIEAAAESGGSFYYSFFLRNDDTIQVQSQGADGNTYYSIGTWQLQDSVFTAHIVATNLGQVGAIQNLTAVYDRNRRLLKNGQIENTNGFFVASFEAKKVE